MVSTIATFDALVASELSAVCFVMDYVEFHFNGPVVRSLSSPVVIEGGERHAFPNHGSRDALCGLIGRSVAEALDEPDQLLLRFAGGAALQIPKRDPEAGAEVAHFIPMVDGTRDGASMVIWENLISTRCD
jgi:hypothetical protein